MSQAPEPRVRIEEVTYPPIRHERLVDRRIDEPRTGESPAGVYAFRISGWAVGNRSPVVAAEVLHRGLRLGYGPVHTRPDLREGMPDVPHAQHSGISLGVSTLDLPQRFRVVVRAVLEDETRSPVAAISGTRAPLQGAPGPGPAPVLLSMIGRSGSTALSNLLCHHPDVAGYRTWDTETRVVSYWADVLRGLARPHSYERQLHAGGSMVGDWWVGRRPPFPDPPEDPRALSAVGRSSIDALASFAREQVGRVNGALASISGKPEARFFVEKTEPAALRSAAEVMEEIEPRTREILLVRDPRDMACSMRAYSEKKGFQGFGPSAGASIEDTIRWLSFNGAAGLVDYMRRRGRRAHVVRYEDFVAHPRDTLAGMLEHIGASADRDTLTDMLERLGAQDERRADHATTGSVGLSVGRWRRELTPAQQDLAEELFRPHLAALGYD